jgi:hypothetical protein
VILRRLAVFCAIAAVTAVPLAPTSQAAGPACTPGGPKVVRTGSVSSADAKTYKIVPFEVQAGTTRVEVGYAWADKLPLPSTPITQTVFDLGLWDEGGVGTPAGFRGWSGSRQGKIAQGQSPVWVQADTAERGYRPGTVAPGRWHVDLGVAAVGPSGATWRVEIRCLAVPTGPSFVPHPVDPTHVANPNPGWYHGDMHMHGYHSNPSAPDWQRWVQYGRDAGLDFLPATDYVTDQHHGELGPIQAANPDVVVWPGREIITYFGHANAIGETPSVVDWRHGFGGVTLRGIQRKTVADGALFQVNHPTIFPGPVFQNFCRGCAFTLDKHIDWDAVDTIEILTGPVLVDSGELGLPEIPLQIQNPFMPTAMRLWDRLLHEGHKITAVSGSDDKLGPGLGSSATAVYAENLSRPALKRALRAGHAYVRTKGVHGSPALEMHAVSPSGQRGIFGDTLRAAVAAVTVRVRGGTGQLLEVVADGLPIKVVPITSDNFTYRFSALRLPTSGPLGTAWRIQTKDLQSFTTVGNPIFLR